MRVQYILLLLGCLLMTFFLGRWSVKQPVQYFSKFAYCKDCLDSCLLKKRTIVAANGNTETIFLDTIRNCTFKTNEVGEKNRRITKERRVQAKPLLIYLDTIIDGVIPIYSDNLSPIERRIYSSYERVKNKIRISFHIYDPQNDYALKTEVHNGQTYYKQETLFDGIIIKDIKTNKVESIRILMDSVDYVF